MSTCFWLVVILAVMAQISLLLHVRPDLALAVTVFVGVGASFLPQSFGVSVGSITISPSDGLAVALLVAVAIGLATRRFNAPPARLWWFLLALVALAALRGAPDFGLEEVGNAVRSHLHFFAVGLFFASMPASTRLAETMHRCWALASWALIGTAVVVWFDHGFEGGMEERALSSAAALIVAQATIMSIARERTTRLTRFLPAAGLITLLLVQQRTVWAATVASFAAVAIRNASHHDGNVRRARLFLGAAVVAVALLVAGGPPEVGRSIDQAVREPAGEDSTLAWRVEGWRQLLVRRSSVPAVDLVVGDPAGTGFQRRVGDSVTEVSAHNYYVAVLTTLGLVGLAALLLGYAAVLRRLGVLARARAPVSNDAAVLWMLVVGQLTYFIGYQASMEQGIIAGLAGAAVWSTHAEQQPSGEGKHVLSA